MLVLAVAFQSTSPKAMLLSKEKLVSKVSSPHYAKHQTLATAARANDLAGMIASVCILLKIHSQLTVQEHLRWMLF
jgi:hypothetical protein